MQFFGKSICPYEGCKMTARYARFGDVSIFAIGLATFLSLAVLTGLNRSMMSPAIDRFINWILIAALAAEGFFMGYLVFRVHTICLICVSIFCFMVLLGITRLLAGETNILAGFGALAAVFLLQYLVLPAGIPVHLPANDRFVLFYGKDCRHCAEVLKDLDEKKITVTHLEVGEYAAYLKSMGIDTVPTLMVNAPYQKLFITGKDSILSYLLACTLPQEAKAKEGRKTKVRASAVVTKPVTGPAIDIFNQPSLLTSPSESAANDGMCKQDEVCK